MAAANYSTLSLAFRWSWSYSEPSGVAGSSGWTVPSRTDSLPSQLRSLFEPAPYVAFLNSSGATATIGANYTATLSDSVTGQYFFLEMELPGSGKVVQAQGQTAPLGLTTFRVSIPVLGYAHSLSPGSYLVHIHDACGAMLYSKTIHAKFSLVSTVRFGISPAACGVVLNGTKQFNGSIVNLTPSTVPYGMAVGCAGHTFTSWALTGGLHVSSGKSLLISASGTFQVEYT
jgi:hypothetical protein